MEARILRRALRFVVIGLAFSPAAAWGNNSYRTENFVVSANAPGLAEQIGKAAEHFRKQLAESWLGRELPPWSDKCPITVQELPHARGGEGAGGATSFTFYNGQPRSWRMNIQGSRQRLLDSVLPHEVLHTVFATHFGRPLPRWADEGACTTVEHESEKSKHVRMMFDFLGSRRALPFNQMFAMTEYPDDIMPLYSQGFSVARFLVAQGGKQKYVAFVGDGMASGNWNAAIRKHYDYRDLSDLQLTWNRWFVNGADPTALSPRATLAAATMDVQGAAGDRAVEPAGSDIPRAPAAARSASSPTSLDDGWFARQALAAQQRRQGGPSPRGSQSVTRPQRPQPIEPLILETSRGGYAPGSIR